MGDLVLVLINSWFGRDPLIPSTLLLQLTLQVSVFVLSSACERLLLLSHGLQQFMVTQLPRFVITRIRLLGNHPTSLKEQWKSTIMVDAQIFQWRRTSFQWNVTIAYCAYYVCSIHCIQPAHFDYGYSTTSTWVLDHCLASLENCHAPLKNM